MWQRSSFASKYYDIKNSELQLFREYRGVFDKIKANSLSEFDPATKTNRVNHGDLPPKERLLFTTLMSDLVAFQAHSNAIEVMEQRRKEPVWTHIVSKSLGDALLTARAGSLDFDVVKYPKFYNVILPRDLLKDGDDSFSEVFISLVPSNYCSNYLDLRSIQGGKTGEAAFYVTGISEKGYSTFALFVFNSKDDIDEAYEQSRSGQNIATFPVDQGVAKTLIKFSLNFILYLHAESPEIESLKPSLIASERFARSYASISRKEISKFKKVGWSFHGRSYYTDSTTVSGHFRWQKHGPAFSQVKLIWIDEHGRTYKKLN